MQERICNIVLRVECGRLLSFDDLPLAKLSKPKPHLNMDYRKLTELQCMYISKYYVTMVLYTNPSTALWQKFWLT